MSFWRLSAPLWCELGVIDAALGRSGGQIDFKPAAEPQFAAVGVLARCLH